MDNQLASILRSKQTLRAAAAELAACGERVRDETSRLEFLRLTLKCQELEQVLDRLANESGATPDGNADERRSG
jgi:hypothetical protein